MGSRAVLTGLFEVPLLVAPLSASGVPLFDRFSRTFGGWAYHPAPLYLLYLAHILVCFSLGIWLTYRFTHEARRRAEGAQARLTLVSMLLPIVIGVFTDGILPVLEVRLLFPFFLSRLSVYCKYSLEPSSRRPAGGDRLRPPSVPPFPGAARSHIPSPGKAPAEDGGPREG